MGVLRNYENDGAESAFLSLVAEENAKRRKGSAFSLFLLLVAGVAISLSSFFFYTDESTGTLALAKEALSDFLEENQAVSVFLGLDDGEGEAE